MSRRGTDPTAERYLTRVRAALRGLPAPQVEDIVLELRGHISERSEAGGDLQETLRALGDPLGLARQFRAEHAATRAECSRSPLAIMQSLLLLRRGRLARWAALVLAGWGFAWSFLLAAAAVEKIFSPRDVGLWARPGGAWWPRLLLDGPGPAGTRELLGWWFVPVAAVMGAALFFLTRTGALWWIRRSRTVRDAPSM